MTAQRAAAQGAVLKNANYADDGPRTLDDHLPLRTGEAPTSAQATTSQGAGQRAARRLAEETGAFASYRVLFNWFVDDKTWDALADPPLRRVQGRGGVAEASSAVFRGDCCRKHPADREASDHDLRRRRVAARESRSAR